MDNETDELLLALDDFIANLFFIAFLILPIILLFLVFPFYVLIHLKNREKDKKLPTYPITSHFFKAICCFNVNFVFLGVFLVLMLRKDIPEIIIDVSGLMFVLTFTFLFMFVQVQHYLICFLSIQRFLLYFLPDKENLLEIGQKGIGRLIRILYFVVFIFNLIIFTLYLYFSDIKETKDMFKQVYMVWIRN
uniref:G_PROTEIN_RECEP_F1_2 domain-containing protein n=1 Tax=Caenorhabditis tropicalis TaxID=1561998 RepID=A0A1I7TUR4_9PELO